MYVTVVVRNLSAKSSFWYIFILISFLVPEQYIKYSNAERTFTNSQSTVKPNGPSLTSGEGKFNVVLAKNEKKLVKVL